MYLNKVFLYGNLTRDPEMKSIPSGTKVTTFGLATNRTWKDKDGNKQESVEFHNIVLFGRQAEVASQYLQKGRPVFTEGRIQTRSWDADDGTKRYKTEIVVDRFQFGPGGGSSSDSSGGNYEQSGSSSDAEGSQEPDHPTAEDEGINPDDIPF